MRIILLHRRQSHEKSKNNVAGYLSIVKEEFLHRGTLQKYYLEGKIISGIAIVLRWCCWSCSACRTRCWSNRSLATQLTHRSCHGSTADSVRIYVINTESVDIVEIAVLPWTGIDIQPHVHSITLMNIELLELVSAEDAEQASARILVFRLNHKFLGFPSVTSALGYALFSRVLFDDHPFYIYSL